MERNQPLIAPLPHAFFSNTTNQNLEIAILFKTVQRSNNNAFGCDNHPSSPLGKDCRLCKLLIVNEIRFLFFVKKGGRLDPGSPKMLRILRWNIKEMLIGMSSTTKTHFVLAGCVKGISAISKQRLMYYDETFNVCWRELKIDWRAASPLPSFSFLFTPPLSLQKSQWYKRKTVRKCWGGYKTKSNHIICRTAVDRGL